MRSDIFKRHQEACETNRKHGGLERKNQTKLNFLKPRELLRNLPFSQKPLNQSQLRRDFLSSIRCSLGLRTRQKSNSRLKIPNIFRQLSKRRYSPCRQDKNKKISFKVWTTDRASKIKEYMSRYKEGSKV